MPHLACPEPSRRAVTEAFASLKAGLDVRTAGRVVEADASAFSSGFAELDRALAGGFIRGTLATLEGPLGSGRTAVLAGVLAAATRTGLAAAIHDDSLYPPDLERAGVRLERLLLVWAPDATAIARSADVLLRSRAFGVVTLPAVPVRGTVWSRLCGLAKKSGALVLTLGSQASTELGYFASTRVRCSLERVRWSEGDGILRELAGYDICTQICKHRRGAPGAIAHLRIA